jgi:hypothetical protein
MSKHSPAPWQLVEHSWRDTSVCDARARPVCALSLSEEDGEDDAARQEADARLISAAPDLLAACEAALKRLKFALGVRQQLVGTAKGGIAGDVDLIEAALRKAKGGAS